MMENEVEESFLKKLIGVLKDYSAISSIAGLSKTSDQKETQTGKTFWSIVILVLTCLGTYWSYEAYVAWNNYPVMTSVDSTAVPVGEVPFPSLYFCNEGQPGMIFYAGIFRSILKVLAARNITFQSSPLELGNQNWSVNDNTTSANEIIKMKNYFLAQDFPDFIEGYTFSNRSTLFDGIKVYNVLVQNDANVTKNLDAIFLTSLAQRLPIGLFYLSPGMFNLGRELGFKQTYFDYDADFSKAFTSIIQYLWYAQLPCFDVKNLTGSYENQASLIKNCLWKGKQISCAALFTLFPTDSGLCCGFNIESAENMFVGKIYSEAITNMQKEDKRFSLSNTTIPFWYKGEPTTKAGQNYGLQVTLDAHTDLFRGRSVYKNAYESFTLMVVPKNEFPIATQRGIKIKRGYRTQISLTSTIMGAEPSLKTMNPLKRNCSFTDEYKLKLFKTYSQSKCLFECSLIHTQNKMTMVNGKTCTPWQLPFIDNEKNTCSSYQKKIFYDNLKNRGSSCSYCLMDCSYYTYEYSLSIEPFRKCNDLNIGTSKLCSIRERGFEKIPFAWGGQVDNQLLKTCQLKKKVQLNISSNVRYAVYTGDFSNRYFNWVKYEAYSKDVSVVNIFFSRQTVWKFSIINSSSWITYFSTVGGLYGLCFGLSIVTITELIWLGLQMITLVVLHFGKQKKAEDHDKSDDSKEM